MSAEEHRDINWKPERTLAMVAAGQYWVWTGESWEVKGTGVRLGVERSSE